MQPTGVGLDDCHKNMSPYAHTCSHTCTLTFPPVKIVLVEKRVECRPSKKHDKKIDHKKWHNKRRAKDIVSLDGCAIWLNRTDKEK